MTRFLSLKRVAFSIVATCGAMGAATAAEPYDMGVMEPGVTYTYPAYAVVTGEYTPSVTGPVKFVYSTNPLALYTSKGHEDESFVAGKHAYTSGGQVMTYSELQAGTTYYIYSALSLMEGSVTIQEGASELKVVTIYPPTDTDVPYSVSENYTVDITFNYPVTVDNALLLVNGARKTISAVPDNTCVTCDVSGAMMDFYRDGTMKEGDEITLRLLQVKDASDPDNKFEEKGKLEIKYKMAAKPAEIVDVVNASLKGDNVFNSYYTTNDENAKIHFVFDRELSSEKTPVARLTYGNADNIEVGIYTEDVKGNNEGNTASFDFSGKLRRPIDMLPLSTSATQPDFIHGSFADIYTPDGQRVYTGSMSNPTGYSLSFSINVLQFSIAADFTPARGSALVPGQEMEIWVMNGDKLNFSGIRFDYILNNEQCEHIIPVEDIKIEADSMSDDAMLYTFKVPAINMDPDSKVTVSLADLECADGLDHNNDVMAEFSYKTSGVEEIEGDALKGSFDIYDIAGVAVMRGATRSDLRNLKKGIYIINGKKVII